MNVSETHTNKPNLHGRYRGCTNIGRLLAAIAATAVLGSAFAAPIAPDALVTQTTHEVQQIVRQDPDLQAGDKHKTLELVEKKIVPHFDFERMTMLAVGRDWARASAEQRQALVTAFRSLLVRTYSGAVALFKDHKIEVRPVQAQGKDSVAVRSRVLAKDGPAVSLDYRMHRTDQGWKVHDVAVDGVSLVTTYRTSFKTVIDRGGFEALINLIQGKNVKVESSSATETAR